MKRFAVQSMKTPSDASQFAPAGFCARSARIAVDMTVLVMSIFVLCLLVRVSLRILVFAVLVLLIISQLNTCRANGFRKAPAVR